MKENYTRIAIVLDRSGSMASVRESTVAGFNEFIRSQREVEGEVKLLLVQFDNEYEVLFDDRLEIVPELTQDRFVPRGTTALLDAQGKTIVTLGAELAALTEEERPSKVIVMTLTDGLENASKEYTLDRIATMIKEQRETYKWEFIYMGANQDAVKVGAAMNIPRTSSMRYTSAPESVKAAMRVTSAYMARSRSPEFFAGINKFTDEERAAAIDKAEEKK